MPPKKNKKNSVKTVLVAKSKKKTVANTESDRMTLRKNPKKKVIDDQATGVARTKTSTKTSVKSAKAAKEVDSDSSFDGVDITQEGDDVEFDAPDSGSGSDENRSSNAVVDEVESEVSKPKLNADISHQVSMAMNQYFEERKKSKGKKRKKRKRRDSTPDSSDDSSTDESSEAEESDDYSLRMMERKREKESAKKKKRGKEESKKVREELDHLLMNRLLLVLFIRGDANLLNRQSLLNPVMIV